MNINTKNILEQIYKSKPEEVIEVFYCLPTFVLISIMKPISEILFDRLKSGSINTNEECESCKGNDNDNIDIQSNHICE